MKNSILAAAVIVAVFLAVIAIVISTRPAQAKGTNSVQPAKTTGPVQLFTQSSPSKTKFRIQKLDPQPYSQNSAQSFPQPSKLNYSQTSKPKIGGKTKNASWN